MTKLMDFGAIEPSDQKNKLADDEYKSLVTPDDGHVRAAELDAEINKAEAALRVLETFDTAREPLFKTRRTVGRDAVAKMRKEQEAAAEDVRRVLELEEKLRNTNDDINKLTQDEIRREVIALQDMGHKRLAIELGEDPVNNPIEYVLESINTIYNIKHKNGAIRRVNVNIAATTVENYRKLHEAGIGTYILFQETYNKEGYEKLHPTGPKHDYAYHTEAMDRARIIRALGPKLKIPKTAAGARAATTIFIR